MAFLALVLFLTVAPAQAAPDAQKAQRLEAGRITKIDTKKRILTVRSEVDIPQSGAQRSQDSGRRGGVRVGGGGGRGGRSGGSRPTSTSTPQGKEFKAVVSEKTTLKEGDNNISFLNLNVGDRITVQGLPKGSSNDLDATQILLVR
jgi:hypothetical protein